MLVGGRVWAAARTVPNVDGYGPRRPAIYPGQIRSLITPPGEVQQLSRGQSTGLARSSDGASAGEYFVQALGHWPCAIGAIGDHGVGDG